MSMRVLEDARERPLAFSWNGPVPEDRLRAWLEDVAHPVPEDLIAVWATVGGGELFESEELYAPDGTSDDLRLVSEFLIERGLPPGHTVFHRGCWVSTIDHATGELVARGSSTLWEEARFGTFDEWYINLLRAEFADRYGLPALRSGESRDRRAGA